MSGNGFAELFAAYLNDTILQVLRTVATVFWFLAKVAAGCMRFLTEANLWDLLLAGMLETLKESMPGILGSVVFGGSGGVGVLYLALMLAGLLLTIPALSSTRLVDAGRAISWGVVLSTLFISSVWGFDLIGYIESLRQGMAQVVVTGIGTETSDLDTLVTTPMEATDTEVAVYDFTLPSAFESRYFTPPSFPQDYESYEMVIGVWPVQHSWVIWVESQESQTERRAEAQTALAVSALTLIPATVLFLFGLIFASLAAAALVLILFFVVALPLGFFEFGTTILTRVVQQYVYLVAITLLAVVLMSILVAANLLTPTAFGSVTTTGMSGTQETPAALMAHIPIYLIAILALSYVSTMAKNSLTDSFGVVSGSVRASFASLNTSGRMPAGSGVLSDAAQAAMNVTGAAALAGMTGGLGSALVAGAGASLGSVSASGGRAAATLAQGVAPESDYAQVFGSAARNGARGGVEGIAAVGSVAARTKRKQTTSAGQIEASGGRTFSAAAHLPLDGDKSDLEWQSVDEGTFRSADATFIEQGVKEYRGGKRVTARNTFTQAFGSRDVAEQVMARLEADPLQNQLPVAEITSRVRRTAHEATRAGKAIFDKQGNFTPAFQQSLWKNLRSDPALKQLDPQDAAQVQFVGMVAGASVRPQPPIWDNPHASHALAQAVLEPETAQIATYDYSAQLSLQGLAHIEGWRTEHLEALFEATRAGQSRSALGTKDTINGIVKEIYTHKEIESLDYATAREAARLALLVTRQPGSGAGTHRATMYGAGSGNSEIPVPPPSSVSTPPPGRERDTPWKPNSDGELVPVSGKRGGKEQG
jgi:hypothetical protein